MTPPHIVVGTLNEGESPPDGVAAKPKTKPRKRKRTKAKAKKRK